MTPQQFAQVEEIFSNVKRLSAVERDAFLESSCAGDRDVLVEVRSLLAADESSGNLLSLNAPLVGRGFAIRTALAASVMPAQIDRYHLLELIGEGGMGSVYRAEQRHPIRRTVAIKVIKLGCDTVEVIRRFEAERQALAMMDHPNIARVVDAGSTETGRPYFVMEYVQGVPITQYCDNNRLTVRERLGLFVTVCQAIQHAHQKGIIHRDLKPSNVLVMTSEGRAVPKVIDFGVAKALHQRLTEETLFTQLGGMVGTPQYMSPEQADSEKLGTDTRSDIYSLGVLLYELLTGTTPLNVKKLRDNGPARMMQMIRETESPKPSARLRESDEALASVANLRGTDARKLLRLVKGDLDWIIMRALEKDRSRRYETADGLGRDIERYLSDEPVEATPPSTTYKLRKFARKHRTALRIAALIMLVLTTSTIISIWQAVRATRAVRNAVVTMADMYTSRAIEVSGSSNAIASLWFAKTATIVASDPMRVESNLIRANNWFAGTSTPVAAVRPPRGSADHLYFAPKNPRYLIAISRDPRPDQHCHIWDLAREESIRLPSDFQQPTAAAWTPDGQLLLGNAGGAIVLVSPADPKILRTWGAAEPIAAMAVSADGKLLAATAGAKLIVWALAESSEPAIGTHPANISYVAFSPGGDHLATVADQRASVFSVALGAAGRVSLQQTVAPVPHAFRTTESNSPPMGPVFMDGGRVLVTIDAQGRSGVYGTFKWRDAASGRELAKNETIGGPWTMDLSPDGKVLAVLAGAGWMYDVNGKPGPPGMGAIAVAFNPRRPIFATCDNIGMTFFQRLDGKGERIFVGQPIRSSPANSMSFSDDGNLLAVGGSDGLIRVWRLPSDGPNTPPGPLLKYDGRGSLLTFSPDGRFVAPSGIMDTEPGVTAIQVFAVQDARPVGAKLNLNANLCAAAFSPDSRLIAAATGFGPDAKLLRIWDWQSGNQVCPTYDLPAEPGGLAFAPDGKSVAVHCVDGQVLFINPIDGQLQMRSVGVKRDGSASQGCGTLCFSRDGKTYFTLGARALQAWNRETGALRFSMTQRGRCLALAESPDGRILAAGTTGGELCFWSAEGRELFPPIEHPGNVLTVAFSPDGETVVTSCKDTQVRLWDVKTGALVRTLRAGGMLADARFTHDGRWILTTGYSSSPDLNSSYSVASSRLWDAQTGFPVTQPFFATGGYHQQIDLSADGRWAAIGASSNHGVLIDLHQLTSRLGTSPQDALLWCEIVSGLRVENSEAVNLTSVEWLSRWHEYRATHAEFQPMVQLPTTRE